MSHECGRLHVWSFGLALGILWSLGILLTGLASYLFGTWGDEFIKVIASAYYGYSDTLMGSFAGAGWAFVDGFVGGAIFAWLYNCIGRCCAKCCKKECKTEPAPEPTTESTTESTLEL